MADSSDRGYKTLTTNMRKSR